MEEKNALMMKGENLIQRYIIKLVYIATRGQVLKVSSQELSRICLKIISLETEYRRFTYWLLLSLTQRFSKVYLNPLHCQVAAYYWA